MSMGEVTTIAKIICVSQSGRQPNCRRRRISGQKNSPGDPLSFWDLTGY
jgi:hypothetical protein